MIDPGAIASSVRVLTNLAKEAGKVELREKIVELVGQLNEVVADNSELRRRIEDLETRAQIKSSLQFRRFSYWTGESDSEENGPYCTKCWDVDGKLVRMLQPFSTDFGGRNCPNCASSAPVFPEREPKQGKW